MSRKKYDPQRRIARGQPAKRDLRGMEDGPCPSRGPHDAKCLCKGTGKVKVHKLWECSTDGRSDTANKQKKKVNLSCRRASAGSSRN
jgi:hypothetical protein